MKPSKQIQWNHQVHQRWAKEQLVFWRLGFYPTYQREEVPQALEVVCGRHDIRGRVVYEVFGQHDLLVRLWLPQGVTPEDVERDFKRTLAAFHLELCDRFVVNQIVTHWFWDEESLTEPRPRSPEETTLALPPSTTALSEVSELVDAFNSGDATEAEVFDHPKVAEFLSLGLLGVRRARSGIKFAIIVSVPSELGTRWSIMDSLAKQLERRLGKARAVMERSLYRGEGFGRFLILGKIDPADFFRINEDLIGPIVDEAQLAGVYRTRSLTYIGNTPDLMSFSEALALNAEDKSDEDVDIKEVLAGGENARVEFKGSIFVNVERFAHQNEREKDPEISDTFLRSIVAMLNSDGGGVVVSGVLEASSRSFGERFTDLPAIDGLLMLGAEFDWQDWNRPEWDEFENRVRNLLRDFIEPNPLNFLSISRHVVMDRTLCAVSVNTPVPPMWFYLRRGDDFVFAVRQDSSSKVISGPEEDSFKKFSPRP